MGIPAAPSSSCPDVNELLDLLGSAVHPAARARIEAHVDGCVDCRGLLADLARALPDLRSARAPVPEDSSCTTDDSHASRRRPVLEDIHDGASQRFGRYVILEQLGAGGMGVVYRAYDPDLRRELAVKLLHTGGQAQSEQKRLLREARAMARLAHPNTVAVFDVGKAEDRVFVAMELVAGATLRAWLTRPRGWREVVAVFLQAGSGLAAAHAAGLVHRDFKPQNVLVGDDGRVRVMDFGLARPNAGDSQVDLPQVTSTDLQLASVRTITGALVGTPLYMAPEQFLGDDTDPRTDQFAFCVALYEALYAQPPFARDDLARLREAVLRGELRRPPPHTAVPRAVFTALARGLMCDPADRYPTLAPLLARLTASLQQRQRRVALAALLVGGLAGAGALRLSELPADSVCADPTAQLAGVWDDPGAVRAAFLATDKPYAGDSFERVDHAFTRFEREWSIEYATTCMPDAAARSRRLCLERLRDLAARLTDKLLQTDASLLESAVLASHSLPAPASCRHPTIADEDVPDSDALAGLQADVVLAGALRAAGRYEEALRLARATAAAARTRSLRPLAGAALLEAGQAAERLADHDEARRSFEEALHIAEATGQDALAVRAWIAMLGEYGASPGGPTDEAEAKARHAEALIERIGGDDELRAMLAQSMATVYWASERDAEAEPLARRAVALSEQVFGPDHWRTADALNALGKISMRLPDHRALLAIYERILAIRTHELGPDHPQVAVATTNLGQALHIAGYCVEANDHHEQALATAEAALPLDHPLLGIIDHNILSALYCTERSDDILPYAWRIEARALARRPPPIDHAQILLGLGRLAFRFARYEESDDYTRRALALLTPIGPRGQRLRESAQHLMAVTRANRIAATRP